MKVKKRLTCQIRFDWRGDANRSKLRGEIKEVEKSQDWEPGHICRRNVCYFVII